MCIIYLKVKYWYVKFVWKGNFKFFDNLCFFVKKKVFFFYKFFYLNIKLGLMEIKGWRFN